jgi:hypothetical protein
MNGGGEGRGGTNRKLDIAEAPSINHYLYEIAGLESTPYEDGDERNGVAVKQYQNRYYTGSYSQTSAYMKPVMKEKAAKGRVD